MTDTLTVPITKIKGEFVEFDGEKIPIRVYKAALETGLKQFLNRGVKTGMTKEEVKAQVEKNRLAIMNDTVRIIGSPKDKVSGAVKTEAMRLAKNVIKDEIKRQGYKVSSYTAAEITAAAKELLEQDPEIMAEAKANIEKRSEAKTTVALGKVIDLSKAEKSRALKKGDKPPLSAKQAGLVAARAKPTATGPQLRQ